MAGGFAKDGAVQDQIDATVEDGVNQVRSRIGHGNSARECVACGTPIPEARRAAVPGVQRCIACQEEEDARQSVNAGYNRRGSKDSQLR
jgi:phage/conjugal plasmid C-4 type zinc finger TraR family protein